MSAADAAASNGRRAFVIYTYMASDDAAGDFRRAAIIKDSFAIITYDGDAVGNQPGSSI